MGSLMAYKYIRGPTNAMVHPRRILYFSPGMDPTKLHLLTTRERECLRLVARGLNSDQIASELGITSGRVNNLILDARRKLNATDRNSAALGLVRHEGGEVAVQLLPVQPLHVAYYPMFTPDDPCRQDHPPTRVEEERGVYIAPPQQWELGDALWRLTGLQTLVLIATLLVLVTLCGVLAFPLSEGAQRFANLFAPTHL